MRSGDTRVVAALLLATSLACSSAAPVPPPAPAAPPQRLFEPYPAAEVAHVRDPHDYRGKALCQRCHFPDGKLTDAPNALCSSCHRFAHGSHPVDVVQKKPANGLPLLEGGKVACHTCHDPHQRNSVLRMPFTELCKSCHRGH